MADEEDMDLYLQVDQKPPPSLQASPTSTLARSPTSSLENPLSLPPNRTVPYVTNLVSVGAASGAVVAAFSSPEDTLAAFTMGRGKLEKIRQWIGHEGGITCVLGSKEARFGASVIGSCGKDGVVRSWDVRSRTVGTVYQALNTRPLLSMSVSCDGRIIAAGTEANSEDASIVFWDHRNSSAPIRAHTSTHSEDINLLAFHPSEQSLLLSGSADGLLSISNALEDDEDEAVVHVGNWGCSISRAGWSMPAEEIWSHSDMETLATWNNKLDQAYDFGDIRRATATATATAMEWQTDYLIDARPCPWDTNGQSETVSGLHSRKLALLAGNNRGDIALISTGSDPSEWMLEGRWVDGHEGVVRSVFWDDPHGIILSGGEDGKINVWADHSRSATVAWAGAGAGKRTHSEAEVGEVVAGVRVQHKRFKR